LGLSYVHVASPSRCQTLTIRNVQVGHSFQSLALSVESQQWCILYAFCARSTMVRNNHVILTNFRVFKSVSWGCSNKQFTDGLAMHAAWWKLRCPANLGYCVPRQLDLFANALSEHARCSAIDMASSHYWLWRHLASSMNGHVTRTWYNGHYIFGIRARGRDGVLADVQLQELTVTSISKQLQGCRADSDLTLVVISVDGKWTKSQRLYWVATNSAHQLTR